MKANRSLIAIALALSVITLPSAIGAEKTSNKAAGPSPTTVVNTILSGAPEFQAKHEALMVIFTLIQRT
jgi:hypothetical protein